MVFVMLYPKINNVEKNHFTIRLLLGISIAISFILITINLLTTHNVRWAMLSICGIVYVWIITLYSIYHNINIASHVILQTIAIAILIILIDTIIGFRGWSFTVAMPIIIITANVTMFILTLVSRKKYYKYAIYQIILFILSMIPMILIFCNAIDKIGLSLISTICSLANAVIVIFLCGNDIEEELKRRFHI